MKKSVWATLFLSVLPVSAANIVVNPGFEAAGGSLNGWTTPSGGWFVDTFFVNSGSASVRTPCVGASCLSPTGGSLYQDLSTTPAATYSLSFFVNFENGSTPNELQVYWAATQVDDIVNQTTAGWQQVIVNNLTAPTSTTRLQFFGRDDVNSVNLDDISVDTATVSPVPEPSMVALTLAALALVVAWRARQNIRRL